MGCTKDRYKIFHAILNLSTHDDCAYTQECYRFFIESFSRICCTSLCNIVYIVDSLPTSVLLNGFYKSFFIALNLDKDWLVFYFPFVCLWREKSVTRRDSVWYFHFLNTVKLLPEPWRARCTTCISIWRVLLPVEPDHYDLQK